jgi:hypothetical protein
MSIIVPALPSYFEKYTSFVVDQKSPIVIFNEMTNSAKQLAKFVFNIRADRSCVELLSDDQAMRLQINLFQKNDRSYLVEIQRLRGDSMIFINTANVIRAYMQSALNLI